MRRLTTWTRTAVLVVSWIAAVPQVASSGWERQQTGVTTGLGDVVFKSERLGWACGGGTIIRTTDGGQTWSVPYASPRYVDLCAIDFADTLYGLVVGDSGFFYEYALETSDGGLSWNHAGSLDMLSTSTWYADCRLLDSHVMWVTGGMVDWLQIWWGFVCPWPSGSPYFAQLWETFHQVDAVDSATAWVIALDDFHNGEVLRTTNCGDSWNIVSAGFDSACRLCGIDFVDRDRGWIVGQWGRIFHTTDGGFTWTCQYRSGTDTLNDVTFLDSLNGWTVGWRGLVLRTRDGGQSWTREPTGVSDNLNAVSFVDTSNGWAVGDNGTVIHYSPQAGIADWAERGLGSESAVEVSPNPAKGFCRLSISEAGTQNLEVDVYAVSGRHVQGIVLRSRQGVATFPLDLDNLSPGVYFVSITGAGFQAAGRLVIQR